MGTKAVRAAALAALLALPAGVAAQTLVGRVISAADSSAVAGALVTLVGRDGTPVARGSTAMDGSYQVRAPAGGTYLLRVLRIGQRPWQSEPVELARAATRSLVLAVPDLPVELPAITVAARAQCTLSPSDTSVVGSLLSEAEKALALAQATVDEGRLRYLVETWTFRHWQSGATTDSVVSTALGNSWPVRSVPPDSLRAYGFTRADDPASSRTGGATYYGPDANLLFAPWFLESHCFSVSEGEGEGDSLVSVEFRPARRTSLVDIGGRLVLAQPSLQLRRIEWHYVGLPRWVPTNDAGGWLGFQRLASGAWLPVEWRLRAPIAGLDADGHPWRLAGWAHFGGRAVGVR